MARLSQTMILIAVVLVVAIGSASHAADEQPVSPAAARLAQAPDPFAAIAAYNEARAAHPDDVQLDRVYIQRMIWFGTPELVSAQARAAIEQNRADGLAWAVDAYMKAKENQMNAALTSCAQAVELSPNEPFVLRTTAQIMARIDTQIDPAGVTQQTRAALDAIPQSVNTKAQFVDAYRKAADQYAHPEQQVLADATEALRQPPVPTGINEQTLGMQAPRPASSLTVYAYSSRPMYTDPYASGYAAPIYPAWWPNNYSAYAPGLSFRTPGYGGVRFAGGQQVFLPGDVRIGGFGFGRTFIGRSTARSFGGPVQIYAGGRQPFGAIPPSYFETRHTWTTLPQQRGFNQGTPSQLPVRSSPAFNRRLR